MSDTPDGDPKPAEDAPGPPADPLIEPTLVGRMGRDIDAGELTPERMSEPYPGDQWELVPEVLRPFVISQKLSDLADALRARPILYWHPLVAHQIVHLHRLSTDHGYEAGDLADRAQEALQQLLTLHAENLVWGQQAIWKPKPKKTGPTGIICNPHPSAVPGSDLIQPSQLHTAWQTVRAALSSSGVLWTRQPDDKTEDAYRKRIAACAQQLLSCTPIEWTDLWSLAVSPHFNSSGEPSSPYDVPLSALERSIQWHTDFAPAVGAALDSEAALVAKDGVPATLAYFILAHLLSDSEHAFTGKKVREKIDRYRRSLGPKTPKAGK